MEVGAAAATRGRSAGRSSSWRAPGAGDGCGCACVWVPAAQAGVAAASRLQFPARARCRYFTTHPYTFGAPKWMSCPKGVPNCPAACYLKQVGLLPACLAAQGAGACCWCWRGCWQTAAGGRPWHTRPGRHGLQDVLSCHLIAPPLPCPRTAGHFH